MRAEDQLQDEACEVLDSEVPARSSALLQVQAQKEAPNSRNVLLDELNTGNVLLQSEDQQRQCSYQLHGDQDGIQIFIVIHAVDE